MVVELVVVDVVLVVEAVVVGLGAELGSSDEATGGVGVV